MRRRDFHHPIWVTSALIWVVWASYNWQARWLDGAGGLRDNFVVTAPCKQAVSMLKAQALVPTRHGQARNAATPADAHRRTLSVPMLPRRVVPRPGLVDRLIAASDARLVVVVAPPGYGKSTLLAQWAKRDARRFAWVALDAHRPDSSRMAVRSIIASLTEAGMIEPPTSAALMNLVSLGATDVLAAALQCVREGPGLVLVLDDAQVLPASVLREVIEVLLDDLPENSAVALASRSEPPLSIGRLRAHQGVAEIRMRDLAMVPAEAASMLRKAGAELEFEVMQALVRRTEGWPAALYLGALSLKEDPDLAIDGARFGGDDHLLADFLRDEVLASVPPGLLDFSVRASVLDQLSGPVCDEVVGTGGSGMALDRLATISQLLVPLDSAHQSYRWQRVVRDVLRADLRRTEPEIESELHLRASGWYARHGDPDRAIQHAVAAGDAELAGELLWPNILGYVGRGHAPRIRAWLSSFSREQIASSTRLALTAAHAALAVGAGEEASRWALSARASLERSPESDWPPSAAAGLCLVEVLMGRGGAKRMREAAIEAYEAEPGDSPWRPALCLARGLAEHLLGNRAAASSTLSEGADLSGSAAPVVATTCLALSAMIAIENKEWELAGELTDRAVLLVEEGGLTTCPSSALVFAASAAARARLGRADEAKRDLRQGEALLAAFGDSIPWYSAETRVLLAHASLSLADAVAARTLLAEASRLARRTTGAVIFQRWFDDAWAHLDGLAESNLAGPSSLTVAELRILRFLPSHRSFREIGAQLGVSANTVKTQAHAIYRKLGAASRSEAVARASEAGLIAH